MKKVIAVLGGVIILVVAAMIIIPLVVDVDKYRPQIVKAANENMNGSIELGKLSLTLWGRVHVGVDGLKVKDASGISLVSVKDASFDIPYSSVFSGAPLITLVMKQPEINVVKNKDGKLNVMSLMKPSAPSSEGAATGSASSGAKATNKVELPAMALNARIGINIEKAKLVYKDQAMALTNTIDDFNLRVKDFSLTRSTEIELWADLKTTMGKDLLVQGPLKLVAQLKPEISGGEFKSATVVATFTADDLEIQKGAMFHKKKGVATNFKFNGTLSQEALNLKEAAAAFHNAEIVVSGDYHKENGANITFKTKPVDLKSWSEIIPMLKEYDLSGLLSLDGFVKGKPEALTYAANLGIKDFSAKGPNLKAKPVINGEIQVLTDRIEKFSIDLRGPGNDLNFSGKLVSFTKPQLKFQVSSKSGMDLDQWIEFPKNEVKTVAAKGEVGKAGGAPAPEEDRDALLDSLRKNEIARNMVVDGNVSIPFVKAMNVKVEKIAANIQMKNLIAGVSGLNLKLFEGVIKGSFSTDLKPARPEYTTKLAISDLDLSKAIESQFQAFRNTMTGKLSASVDGGGSSFNTEMAKKRLLMKGNFQLLDAQFKTIDVAKMINEALGAALSKVGDKIPGMKGKKIAVPDNKETRYEKVSSTFTIQNGILNAPDFFAKAAPKKGVDLKGFMKMGLIDESLDAKWEAIDTHRVTGADQLNVDIGGKMVKNLLAKGENEPVILPLKVGCKWSAPCSDYSEAPEYLAGVALGRVAKGAGEAAKAKATNAIQDAIKKNIPGGGGNDIGSGLKKLFGR